MSAVKGLFVVAWQVVIVGAVIAADKPAIDFPDVVGWAKNVRYDPPAVPATSIAYTTKAKVGKDYIRVQIAVPKTDGKSLKEMLPALEKKVMDAPIHKNMKKSGSKEITVNKVKVTQVTFLSEFAGTPTETMLYVVPYGDYLIKVEHSGPASDSAKRADETLKLLKALVDATAK